ncbi:hypothetical protein ABZX62_16640 [Streptomyces flavidovirens]|uniref:hypothetical protein n=1 Tax=Streptomyces flavidovirens TaxID=67298 RepID=UPI0033AFCD1E
MSTQTEQTTIPAPAPQGTHHWVMTLELPGRMAMTASGTFTPPAGWTRHDMYRAIKDDIARENPELATANVMFFALEPNQL